MARFDRAVSLSDGGAGSPSRRVFANELRVDSSELLVLSQRAGALGIRDARRLELHAAEYRGERHVLIDGARHTVARVQPRGEKVWLTCERRASDVGKAPDGKEAPDA
ncbi:MAG: hypothetical protein LBL86_07150 [Coriobacteriales bacterium]|jgi:hypothetical protein|nr:hypothetical protein [Coriobacteriales bacterium]